MPNKITVWECKWPGCGYYMKTKRVVETHERTCFYNPERKACRTCGNLCERWIKGTPTFDCEEWKPKQ